MHWFSRFYAFVTICLMLYNLTYLTCKYMKYSTETNTAYYFPVTLMMPKLSLCIAQENRSQIVEEVPSDDEPLLSCRYRDPFTDVLEINNASECASYFKSDAVKIHGSSCYRFDYLSKRTYDFHAVVNSLYEPRVLFSVTVGKKFSDRETVLALLHLDEYPDEERVMEREKYLHKNASFFLAYNLYESYSLPWPYDSSCTYHSQLSCLYSCLSESHNKQNLNQKCHQLCWSDKCKRKVLNTISSPLHKNASGLEYAVSTLASPPLKSVIVPSFAFTDFLSQLAAVVSIWLGVSLLSINRLFAVKTQESVEDMSKTINYLYSTLGNMLRRQRSEARMKWKKPRKNNKAWYRRLIKFLAFSLVDWQITTSCSDYFEFNTTMHFWFEVDSMVRVPTMAVCRDLHAVLGGQTQDITEDNFEKHFTQMEHLMQGDMNQSINLMKTGQIFSSCTMRDPSTDYKEVLHLNSNDCMNNFQLSTFIRHDSLCFSLEPKIRELPIYQSNIALMTTKPGIIYSIEFSAGFNSTELEIFTYSESKFPSLEAGSSIVRTDRAGQEFFFSSQRFTEELLATPFETGCVDRDADCYPDCLRERLAIFDREPYLSPVDPSARGKILSYSDLMNETINTAWREAETVCQTKCEKRSCRHSFTITFRTDQRPMKSVRFTVESPSRPTIITKALPVTSLYQLIFQILCSLSFCLGFSFLSMDPIILLAEKKLRAATENLIKSKFYIRQMMKVLKIRVRAKLKVPKMTGKSLTRCIIWLIACVACIAHFYSSISIYLTYPTSHDVSQRAETDTDAYLILCLDPAELIARRESVRQSISPELRTKLMNRTIESILEAAPSGGEILEGCSYRGLFERQGKLKTMRKVSDRVLFESTDASLCNHLYQVDKFLLAASLCYTFRRYQFSGWNSRQQEGTINDRETLYSVTINSSLLTSKFSFMISLASYFPDTSGNFVATVSNSQVINFYSVSYAKYIQVHKPIPRPNVIYTPFIFHRCLSRCINDQLAPFHLTFSSRFTEGSHLRYLTAENRKMYGLSTGFDTRLSECEEHCTMENDQSLSESGNYLKIHQPMVSRSHSSRAPQGQTVLEFRTTKFPVFWITFSLCISLVEQLIILGSIASIWLGFNLPHISRIFEPRILSVKELKRIKEHVFALQYSRNIHAASSVPRLIRFTK